MNCLPTILATTYVEHMFARHLAVLKTQYYFLKAIGDDGVVFPSLLDGLKLNQ
jgi:hypothetical protein